MCGRAPRKTVLVQAPDYVQYGALMLPLGSEGGRRASMMAIYGNREMFNPRPKRKRDEIAGSATG